MTNEQYAERALEALPLDASDEEIASALAEYYASKRWMMHGKKIRLCILADSAPSRESLKWSKYDPELHARFLQEAKEHERQVAEIERIGFDWHYKNVWGITTDNESRAREWAIAMMLAGFAVFYKFNQRGSGGGKGTVADWRKRQADILRTGRGMRRPDLYDLDFRAQEGRQ